MIVWIALLEYWQRVIFHSPTAPLANPRRAIYHSPAIFKTEALCNRTRSSKSSKTCLYIIIYIIMMENRLFCEAQHGFVSGPSCMELVCKYQHTKLKCTGFYLSQSRMKQWDFLSKTPFEFCRYFQYEQNYAQFTVSLIWDFLYCNYSITMAVNKELI